MTNSTPFTVRSASALGISTHFRVYVYDDQVCLLRLGAQGALAESVTAGLRSQLGVLGGLLGGGLERKATEKRNALTEQLDASDPRILVKTEKGSISFGPSDVIGSELQGPSGFSTNSGSWKLHLRGDRKLKFEFEESEQFTLAVQQLPKVLNQKLVVLAKWDEKHKEYVKGKKGGA